MESFLRNRGTNSSHRERREDLWTTPAGSTQPVFAFDLIFRQSTDTWQRSSTIRDGHRHHDFIGSGRIVKTHFHSIEMTAHESRILVAKWNVERHAHPAAFL